MRQAHWKQPHEGVSGCMDDSKPHSHNTTVGLRVCRRYVLITDPPDDTKKQRRMLASDTYVRLHHQDFITTKRMCSIIGARRIARRGPHTARSGMDCSAARSTTPKTVLKLFINNNTKPAVVKKMEKWKNGKIYSGKFPRINFSIFPFFHFSGIRRTDSWRVSVEKSVRPGHRPPKKWKNGKSACHNSTLIGRGGVV